MPYNLKQARASGVSDEQSARFLSSKVGFRVEEALADKIWTQQFQATEDPTQAAFSFIAETLTNRMTPQVDPITKSFAQMTKQEQIESQTIEANPWVDPVSAAIAGFGSGVYFGRGAGIIGAGLKGLTAGALNAVMDAPIGVIVDEVDKADSAYSLPLALGLGVLSGKIIESPLETRLLKGLSKLGIKSVNKLTALSKGIRSDLINDDYNQTVNKWIGVEDWQEVTSDVQMQGLRRAIQESVDESQKGTLRRIFTGKLRDIPESQKIDEALHIYIDLKRNPEHLNTYFDQLSDYQKGIVQLSQSLTPRQIEIANQIEAQYELMLKYAQEGDLNINSIDNYVNRVWKLRNPNRANTELFTKFKTNTKHARGRTLDTILEGWARKGSGGQPLLELAEPGATRSLNIYENEITKVVNNKAFLNDLLEMTDLDGAPLLSTKELPGYKQVEHPNFKKWVWIGQQKVDIITKNLRSIHETATEQVTRAGKAPSRPLLAMERVVKEAVTSRGFTEGEADNMILRLKTVGSSEEAEQIIKTVEKTIIEKEELAGTVFKKISGPDFYQAPNGAVFHKARVYANPAIAKNLNNMLGVSALKGSAFWDGATKGAALTKSWKLFTSFFHDVAFMNSYYLGGQPFGEAAGKIKAGEGFIDAISELHPRRAYQAGLKAITDLEPEMELLVKNGLTLGRIQDWEEAILRNEDTVIRSFLHKTKTTGYVADSIIALREAHTDFMFQQFGKGLKAKGALIELKSLLAKHPELDPNEAAGMVARLFNDDFGGLHLKRLGRNPTTQHMARLLALAPDWTESNLRSMTGVLKQGTEGELYQRFWMRVIGKTIFASLAMNAILSGGKGKDLARKYGQAWEHGKLRILDVDVTPIYKATGGDEDVTKYFQLAGHFKDPYIWSQRPIRKTLYYKTSIVGQILVDAITQTDWLGRQFTSFEELLATGRTVRPLYTFGVPRPGVSAIPSFILNKLESAGLPIPAHNIFQWWKGEMDGFDANTKSIGLKIGQEPIVTPRMKAEDKKVRKQIKSLYPKRRQK